VIGVTEPGVEGGPFIYLSLLVVGAANAGESLPASRADLCSFGSLGHNNMVIRAAPTALHSDSVETPFLRPPAWKISVAQETVSSPSDAAERCVRDDGMLLELLLFDGNNRTNGNANKRHSRHAGAGEETGKCIVRRGNVFAR